MKNESVKILVLGVSGMLGNAVFRVLTHTPRFLVYGSIRSPIALRLLPNDLRQYVVTRVDVENLDSLARLFAKVKPTIVINCIGLVKQLSEADDPLAAIPINAVLPHRLARLCEMTDARLVHMSTDCVFSGSKGMYKEADLSDATDLYGRSKYLGEVDYPNAITLRTSIIGHELDGARSLVGWFLAQTGSVTGFKRAIFSGIPTVEIARIIRDHVIPHPKLHGVYNVSAAPINKFDLLNLIAKTYEKSIEIRPDEKFVIDRSLDSTRFREATGFQPKAWPELIKSMRDFS